jgi:hypothetical protein
MADLTWNPKDPDETVRYIIDWSEIGDDTIESFTLTVSSGTVTIGDTDFDDTHVFALISGGADAETATLAHSITTTLGQVLEKTITLKIAADADVFTPVSTITKGMLIIRALGKLGIANYVFDTEAEEDVSALRQLDSLASSWQGKLRPFGYIQPATNGASLPTDDAGIDESDIDAFIYNLAEAIAPDYGKAVPPQVTKRAADERSTFLCKYQITAEFSLRPGTPLGARNRRFYNINIG